MTETIELITCASCSKQFESVSFYSDSKPLFQRTLCDPCDEIRVAKFKRDENAKLAPLRLDEFKRFCPAAYLESDMSRLPHEALGKVVSYKIWSKGLFCVGESGRGKTRSCWLLLKQLYVQGGVRMICLTEAEFAEKVDYHSESRETDKYLDSLKKVPLLFLDDIGHAALDKKYLQRLYEIVEARTSCNRPIIATTQFTGNELTSNSKLNGAEKTLTAIVRRLREFCLIVNFNEN